MQSQISKLSCIFSQYTHYLHTVGEITRYLKRQGFGRRSLVGHQVPLYSNGSLFRTGWMALLRLATIAGPRTAAFRRAFREHHRLELAALCPSRAKSSSCASDASGEAGSTRPFALRGPRSAYRRIQLHTRPGRFLLPSVRGVGSLIAGSVYCSHTAEPGYKEPHHLRIHLDETGCHEGRILSCRPQSLDCIVRCHEITCVDTPSSRHALCPRRAERGLRRPASFSTQKYGL